MTRSIARITCGTQYVWHYVGTWFHTEKSPAYSPIFTNSISSCLDGACSLARHYILCGYIAPNLFNPIFEFLLPIFVDPVPVRGSPLPGREGRGHEAHRHLASSFRSLSGGFGWRIRRRRRGGARVGWRCGEGESQGQGHCGMQRGVQSARGASTKFDQSVQ